MKYKEELIKREFMAVCLHPRGGRGGCCLDLFGG